MIHGLSRIKRRLQQLAIAFLVRPHLDITDTEPGSACRDR